MNSFEIIDAFRQAMREAGVDTAAELVADGRLHRVPASGDRRGRKDGWYVLHDDGVPNGIFGHHRLGIRSQWCAKPDRELTAAEKAENARRIEAARKAREADERKARRDAAKRAAELWDGATPATAEHAYLVRKGVQPHGLRATDWPKWRRDDSGQWEEYRIPGALLVPIRNALDELLSLEAIFPEKTAEGRDKDFLTNGEKVGAFFAFGEITGAETALLCEGWATGASLHECTGLPVVVAFDAGNLKPVAAVLRSHHASLGLVVCGDNDRKTEGNPGATKAAEAAAAGRGVVCLPEFSDDEPGSDWNDVHLARGADAVRDAVLAAVPQAADAAHAGAESESVAPGAGDEQAPAAAGSGADGGALARFKMDAAGLWVTLTDRSGNPMRPRFVVEPFEVLAMVRDHHGLGWGLLIELGDPDGRRHRVVLPHSQLIAEGAEALRAMVTRGCVPRHGADRYLLEYLKALRPAKRARITDRTGWHESGAFVLPDTAIGEAEEPVIFQTDGPGSNQFRAKGTAAEWRDRVGRLCVGNSRLVFGVSAALAAPLLHLAGAEGGGFHYRGGSSSGKTTILRVAASLCGPPEYMQRWRATDNGIEGLALAHSDCPLLLDELAQLDPKSAGEVAYMLGNGSGKTRAARTGSLRERSQWRVLFQSAGEIGLAEHMAEAGKRTKAGQEVRLCEVPADAGAGLGCFRELHGYANGAEFAKALDMATRQVYGSVWLEYLRGIYDRRHDLPDLLRGLCRRFEENVLTSTAEGQARRALQRFALVAAAGEIGTLLGLTGWSEGEAIGAARSCFKAWLAQRGGEGNHEARAWLRQVRTFLRQYGESAFADWDRPSIDTDTRAPVKSDRAGYRRVVPGDAGVEFYIFSDLWRERVCRGIDHAAAGRLLVESGYAETGTEKDRPHLVRVTLPSEGRARVVHILPTIFEDEDA